MSRRIVAGLAVSAACIVNVGPLAAAVRTGGDVDSDPSAAALTIGLEVSAPGSAAVYSESSSDAPSPIRFEVVTPLVSAVAAPAVFLCGPGGTEADPENPWGAWVAIVAFDTATGEEVGRTNECVPIDPTDPTAIPAPALPRPPSIVEIWRAIAIPAPELHANPAGEGVTGLPTWLWSGGPTERAVSVTLDGWTLTGTARLTGWSYDPGDGTPPVTANAQGSGDPEHHAAEHLYEIKGTYELTVTANWEAELTLSGHGVTGHPVDIGTARLTTTRTYPVVEVRAVLVP